MTLADSFEIADEFTSNPAFDELKSRARWVAWRQDIKAGKVPVNPHTGRNAATDRPNTWGTYEQAVQRARSDHLPGVGYVLGDGDGNLTGFDLDKCRNPVNGRLKPWAAEILRRAETYAEVSPSGTGVRFFARGKVADATKCNPAGIEIYGTGRYLTVTGHRLESAPDTINPAPRTLAACQTRGKMHQETWAKLKKAAPLLVAAFKGHTKLDREVWAALDQTAATRRTQASNGAGHKQRERGAFWRGVYQNSDSNPFFRNVNSAALQNLSAWVPTLFGTAAKPNNKGYRVSSADLGRDLEEDLSITPQGIKDFGVHDMGDPDEGKRTPITIVLEYGSQETAADAALWLCECLGIDPASLGWQNRQSNEGASQEQPQPPITKLSDWLTRDLPKPDLVQGDIMSTTSRVILWAPTGIGKTLWGVASAMAMAAGRNFLGWRGHRPMRVLYIDGEMSRVLLQERLRDEAKRLGIAPENFHALSHEDIEGFAPLNTPEGQKQIEREIARINPEFIYADNIMSLTGGVMKEEESWRHIMPWVLSLTRRCIGQLWIHHTGHDETKGYGTKTREWHMDTVIGLAEVKRDDTDVSFKLTFYKKRLCTPANRDDFVEKNVALVDNRWVFSEADKAPIRISPLAEKFLAALIDATIGNEANKMIGCPAASWGAWQGECIKRGLLEREKGKITLEHTSRSRFSKSKLELITANRIACNDTMAWVL